MVLKEKNSKKVKYIQKSKNYYQKIDKDGKKKRISKEEYMKNTKNKQSGGGWGNPHII